MESTIEDRLRLQVELGTIYFGSGWLPEAEEHYTRALEMASAMEKSSNRMLETVLKI